MNFFLLLFILILHLTIFFSSIFNCDYYVFSKCAQIFQHFYFKSKAPKELRQECFRRLVVDCLNLFRALPLPKTSYPLTIFFFCSHKMVPSSIFFFIHCPISFPKNLLRSIERKIKTSKGRIEESKRGRLIYRTWNKCYGYCHRQMSVSWKS